MRRSPAARFSQAEKRAHEDKVVRIAGQEIPGHIDDTDEDYRVRLPGRALIVRLDRLDARRQARDLHHRWRQPRHQGRADRGRLAAQATRRRCPRPGIFPARRRARPADEGKTRTRHVGPAALPDAGPDRVDRGHEGDTVEEGQTLAVVEAMKMENVLRAERRGVVSRIPVKPGDSLAVDEIIMEFAK